MTVMAAELADEHVDKVEVQDKKVAVKVKKEASSGKRTMTNRSRSGSGSKELRLPDVPSAVDQNIDDAGNKGDLSARRRATQTLLEFIANAVAAPEIEDAMRAASAAGAEESALQLAASRLEALRAKA